MPLLRPEPMAEEIVIAGLRLDPDLVGLLTDGASTEDDLGRIATDLPEGFPDGRRLQPYQVGGIPASDDPVQHLKRARIQFHAFGSSRKEAHQVATAALAGLYRLPSRSIEGAVVTHVRHDLGLVWSPDPPTGTPRWIFGVSLTLHAAG